MLFHNARLAVRTLILALMFVLGAGVSPAQESEPPAAYLAANSPHGIELFALYANGSLAKTSVLLEGAFMYGSESFRDWSIVVEVPDGIFAEKPKLVDVDRLSLSPNATRIAYFWASISEESEEKREPEGITVVDLTNAVTRDYPLSSFPVDMPQWSSDSQAFLLDQHKVDPDIYRVDFFDYANGKFQTVIDGFDTFHVVRYWITPEQFLILEWPEIYLGDLNCVCAELLIAVDEGLVGASEQDGYRLDFGRGAWSSRDKQFYLTISDITEDSIPNIFAGLYALNFDGKLTRILDYQTLYAGDPLQNAPFIITDSPYQYLCQFHIELVCGFLPKDIR